MKTYTIGMKNKIETRDVNFWYGDFHALKGISMDIEEKSVIAFIGPSGCGKSTFLRLLNRMNDLIPDTRLTGEIRIDGQDIYGKGVQVDELRKNVGMVFQRPNPFPKSIFENVAYGLRVNGITDNAFIRQRVEETLKGAALWDEVKDKLKVSAYALSGGQQQRLHSPCHGGVSFGPADGRAGIRPRPHLHRQGGRAYPRVEEAVHYRHRHPQHATGSACQ